MFGHWSAAISASRKHPAPKCGITIGTDGSQRKARDRERVAEPKIKRRWQSEFLPDPDRQHSAVHEHGCAMRRGCLEHFRHSLVVEPIPVHCRKEGHGAQPALAQRVLEPHTGVGGHRIEHEESDEASRMPRYRNANRRLIAGNAGDEAAPGYTMKIEFGDPSVREHFWSTRRLPAEPPRYCDSPVVHGKSREVFREEFKEARGEEMAVAVAKWHEGILVSFIHSSFIQFK